MVDPYWGRGRKRCQDVGMPCRIQLAQLSGRKPKFQEEDYESTVGHAKVSSLLPHFSHLEQSTTFTAIPGPWGCKA